MKAISRRIRAALVILILLCLCACGAKEFDVDAWRKQLDERGMSEDSLIMSDDYSADTSFIDTGKLSLPQGIARVGEYIVIADRIENCLFAFDNAGELLKTIGKTGQGELQFLRPTGLYFDGEVLYVVDSGNSRVQLLDSGFEYVGEKALNEVEFLSENTPSYSHIVVDGEKNIYVSFPQAEFRYEYVYKISADDDSVYLIGVNMTGCLARQGDNVYFANTYELNPQYNNSYNGENYVYTINGDALDTLFELPYGITPQDMFVLEDGFYVIDGRLSSVDRFDMSGEYVDTVFRLNDLGERVDAYDSFLFHDSQSGYIFLSVPSIPRVVCLKTN